MRNQKDMIQTNLFTNRKRLTDLEKELMVAWGLGGENRGMRQEVLG